MPWVDMVIEDIIYKQIRKGKVWVFDTSSVIVTGGATKYYLIVPGSSLKCFVVVKWAVVMDQDGKALFYESPTLTDDGSDITSSNYINKNRHSSTSTGTKTYEDPTVTDDGMYIDGIFLNTATGRNLASLSQGGSAEWDLDVSKKYLIKIVNSTSNDMTVQIKVVFVEEV